MDHKESTKVRRPLPNPKAAPSQRPNTPVVPSPPEVTISSPNVFGDNAIPMDAAPQTSLGSSHTTYIPPGDPPAYNSSGFREPVLITDESTHGLTSSETGWSQGTANTDNNGWANSDPWESQWDTSDPSNWNVPAAGDSTMTYNHSNYVVTTPKLVDIDGRDEFAEKNWWDPQLAARNQAPGPGMLPTVLAEDLHDPNHSLFSVSVTPPDNRPTAMRPTSSSASVDGASNVAPNPSPSHSARSPPTPQIPSSPSTISHPSYHPPNENDVRTSVPHPNAYYCPKENGWVILVWKSSSAPLPLAESFQRSDHAPLPSQTRRRWTNNCLSDRKANKTHHFHKYFQAVDAHKLTPAFRLEEWEVMESMKQKRRTAALLDIDVSQMSPVDIEMRGEQEEKAKEKEEGEGKLLDLYVCCQCSFYCVASAVLPGVIPRKLVEELVKERKSNPVVGKTGEQAVALAFETFVMVLENSIWKGEARLLRVGRPNFQNKVGWNSNTKKMFEVLGFTESPGEDNEMLIRPPTVNTSTSVGRANRKKLLRACVEFGAWLADFKRIHIAHFRDWPHNKFNVCVQITSAREEYQTAIGAHPDQIPRGELPDNVRETMQLQLSDWQGLGLTPMSYSAELLAFSYYAQCRCDPRSTYKYFSYFTNVVETIQSWAVCPPLLQEILVMERSRDRFTVTELDRAAETLGFGINGPLRVEYDETDVEESFIENAWKECVKRSWRETEHGTELLRNANEALRILAEARGSEALRKVWERSKERVMNPERAYDVLEVPKDVDETMLITVFNMRMEESPGQQDKMREALLVIAEVRDSDRLRQFLELGRDPGDIIAPIRPDLPRGLNQLGNTCYLNSLLQYFYTIKDLREAVIPMSKLDVKSLDGEKLTDDDLKRHRVGGRLVTRREIVRSRKFINQLAELFFNLEWCETPAVTPSIELAKLALVTSRDEEEDEADRGGTDSSNDTDATLVEDSVPRPPANETASAERPQSPTRSPNSVLGKRSRGAVEKQLSSMDLDSPAPSSLVHERCPSSPICEASDSPPPLMSPDSPYEAALEASGSGSLSKLDEEVEIQASTPVKKPPPLPPRKTAPSDSVMMFGKQHDVAECMDNCMFQIETALLKFDGEESRGESSDKTSVVKRLFYGKLRQRLTGPQSSQSSIHEKEDLFSHLPVNVTNDGGDIYDGLSRYFDDIVDFQGEKRRMEVSLVELPPVLQIQLQRVQFNRETLQPYKSQAYVKFGEMIYMDRFMENADPEKRARSKVLETELNICRDRLQLLLQSKDGPYLSSLEQTRGFLSKLENFSDLDDDLIMQLDTEQPLLTAEIDGLRGNIDYLKGELESVWQDSTEMAYQLTSVFVHRGSSPSWGHYFFYSRHLPDNPDSWFKYNDSDVTVVSKDEVLADTTGSTANPYLLVFARKGSEVVDTVKRFDPSTLE